MTITNLVVYKLMKVYENYVHTIYISKVGNGTNSLDYYKKILIYIWIKTTENNTN